MVTRSGLLRLGVGVAVGIALLLVVGGVVLAVTFEQPRVEKSESAWGEVRDGVTPIETDVVVTNPNVVGVPGVVDITYTATLNDVTLATGEKHDVGFGTGTNTIELDTEMRNERIADWWVTHVNNDERSTLAIEAMVVAPGFSRTIPSRESTIETNLLGGFAESGDRTITVRNDSFLIVRDQQASWGTANETTTPLTFSSTVENVHDYDVTLDGIEYVVTMNEVELGREQLSEGVAVQPGQETQLDVRVGIDTPKMADWWAEHVRDDEESNLSVRMYGLVEHEGERRRVPLRLYDERLHMTTDMLGEDDANVSNVGTNASSQNVTLPAVTETDQSWGTVTDSTTDIETTSTLTTPEGELTDLLALNVTQRTAINGILVATANEQIQQLQPGTSAVDITAVKDNQKVPDWWARHVNQNEQSTIVTTPTTVADVAFTKFDVAQDEQTSTFETDMLAGMNGDSNERVVVDGRTALVITETTAAWGRATPQTAPIELDVTVENRLSQPVDVTNAHYTVEMNSVVLADKDSGPVGTIGPRTTETLTLPMELENQRMDRWWVTHIRNDETTAFDVTVTATVETRAGSTTQELDSLGNSETIETDILNQDTRSPRGG